MTDAPAYLRRDRAESFGAVAADYDRYRPGYPEALIDDLVAPAPATVLDVGCGTGKAARLIAARGPSVLGVEIDPQMAQVARGHGIPVEVGSFEDWDDRGRRFDLISSAQAWHWVDPVRAAPKAARLLAPGGRLALFWNYDDVDDAAQAVLDRVYAQFAPELSGMIARGASNREDRPYAADLEKSGAFGSIEIRRYPWEHSVPLDVWIGRTGTHSDHLLLGRERLETLLGALRRELSPLGEDVRTHGGTYTIYARP
ncbi:MAG TPA: class I SAM-dependent methyltransferase [Jatrophihabitans sp.]|nr:class I SAM-dependent methyltransferase [Jatrophihabitans sp.]